MTVPRLSRFALVQRLSHLLVFLMLLTAGATFGLARAQSTTSYFQTTASLRCEQMVAQHEGLILVVDRYTDDRDLAYTQAIPGRINDLLRLRDAYDALRLVEVPFVGEDLSELPRPAAPPLLPITESRTFTMRGYEDPTRVGIALATVAATVASGLFLDNTMITQSGDDGGFAVGNMTLMFGAIGAASAALQLYVSFDETETVRLPANARINEQRRAEYAQALVQVNDENVDRRRKVAERQEASEENERIAAELARLEERLRAFADESRRIVLERIAELDQASLRCLDRLAYAGSVIRLAPAGAEGRITLAVTPVARSGQPMRSTDPASEFRFSVSDLTLLSRGSTRVELAGARVVGVRPFDREEFPLLPVTVMVVVDSSGSMRNNDPQGLRREGLVRFLDQAPPSARIGVMEFGNGGGRVLAPITNDMQALKEAVQRVRADGGTPLYASGRDALDRLRADGGTDRRVLVMLSDGTPDGDPATADELVSAARDLGVPVYAIGLGSVDFSGFERVALATGGTFTAAPDAEAVVEALAGLGIILNAVYAIDVAVPSTVVAPLQGTSSLMELEGEVAVEHEGIHATDRVFGAAPIIRE